MMMGAELDRELRAARIEGLNVGVVVRHGNQVNVVLAECGDADACHDGAVHAAADAHDCDVGEVAYAFFQLRTDGFNVRDHRSHSCGRRR